MVDHAEPEPARRERLVRRGAGARDFLSHECGMYGRWLARQGVWAGGDACRAAQRRRVDRPADPEPRGAAASAMNGVSCPSGSACTGVGQFVAGSGVQLALAERWNGSNWAIQPTPNPAGSPSSRLFAVACPAADACTAVGAADSKLLVERWGGARWRIQSAPVPAGAIQRTERGRLHGGVVHRGR